MPLADFKTDYADLCARLCRIRGSDRLGHAYLFVGDDTQFLEQFAKAWIQVCACHSPGDDGDACGACKICRQIQGDTYPELYTLRPMSKSRQILVEEMRDFEHKLLLTGTPGKLKAGLVLEADRLNTQAQNSFLKTLEEPPKGSMLVLATTQPRGLLPTIRSRCQTVSLLQNKKTYDFAMDCGLFPLLSRLRQGAGAAVALGVAHELRDLLAALRAQAEHMTADSDVNGQEMAEQDPAFGKRMNALRQAQTEAEYRRLRQELLDAVEVWFMQCCLVAEGVAHEHLPHPEFFDAANGRPETLDKPSWESLDGHARAASELMTYLERNVDERLAVETFCLTVCQKSSN
ncbi:MAG: hypothetical protein K9N51_06315 [Candidatus Pacebacteria bacterium]|nr:hypothetical protein [Candidatus Paceibacterota bacterium]